MYTTAVCTAVVIKYSCTAVQMAYSCTGSHQFTTSLKRSVSRAFLDSLSASAYRATIMS